MKLFGRGNAKGKPAPITRAGRVIDETQRESAKKSGKVVKLDDQRKKSGGKK